PGGDAGTGGGDRDRDLGSLRHGDRRGGLLRRVRHAGGHDVVGAGRAPGGVGARGGGASARGAPPPRTGGPGGGAGGGHGRGGRRAGGWGEGGGEVGGSPGGDAGAGGGDRDRDGSRLRHGDRCSGLLRRVGHAGGHDVVGASRARGGVVARGVDASAGGALLH